MVCYGQEQSSAQALQLLQVIATSKLWAENTRLNLCLKSAVLDWPERS